jgi:hypothetical protein
VAFYPLSSQAPIHVEVELGCDKMKVKKVRNQFGLIYGIDGWGSNCV